MGHLLTCENESREVRERQRPSESKLKLSLEVRASDEVIVLHCKGRIVYREEARALSRVFAEALRLGQEIVLHLEGVESIDSAGLGELVLAHLSAKQQDKSLRLAAAKPHVRELFDLTRLGSVFAIYPSVEKALAGGARLTLLN